MKGNNDYICRTQEKTAQRKWKIILVNQFVKKKILVNYL